MSLLKKAMGPVAGALVGGGVTAASSAKQAQKQMDFQKEMASTKYQRGTEDLKKAGLNPILAAGGATADSAGGAMGQTPDVGSLSTAAQLAKGSLEQMKAQTRLTTAEAGLAEEEKGFQERLNAYKNRGLDMLESGAEELKDVPDKITSWATGLNPFRGTAKDVQKEPKKYDVPEALRRNPKNPSIVKPKKGESKKSFIQRRVYRPWGEFPSLADPDYNEKRKYYEAQKKKRKNK